MILTSDRDVAINGKCDEMIEFLRNNIIGMHKTFSSPFGKKKVLYCDYIASGRSLRYIENYILEEVLPLYGSTHTSSTITSLQTTLYRDEARGIIRNATRASENDCVLFIGSGATGAINKLIHVMDLQEPPIVFVDPYAHHSSLLPWREMGAKVIRIQEDDQGHLDMRELESALQRYKSGSRTLIGCFAAASNVTGIMSNDVEVSSLMHRYNGLVFWDYATAAPYIQVEMNAPVSDNNSGLAYKDAVFFSMHKFLGGVQTPGILIAKKSLFKTHIPHEPGGGTIFFVSRNTQNYLKNIELREEGGTPAIVECVRAGLVMQLKMKMPEGFISQRNRTLNRMITTFVQSTPGLVPLGNIFAEEKLPVLSFIIFHEESGYFLHYYYVCAILNDLYGIQARGGCACAGPYAQDLLNISEDLAVCYEELLREDPGLDRHHLRRLEQHSDLEILRPGFTRINFHYTMTDEEVDFIFTALERVCRCGWKLLPQYIFNPSRGEWKHHTNLIFKERLWMQSASFKDGEFLYKKKPSDVADFDGFMECIATADVMYDDACKAAQRREVPEEDALFVDAVKSMRWFLLPSEAKKMLVFNEKVLCEQIPFFPVTYPLCKNDLLSRPTYVWGIGLFNASLHAQDKVPPNNKPLHIEPNRNVVNEVIVEQPLVACSRELKQVIPVCSSPLRRWITPPRNIFTLTLEAIQEFQMIKNNDKILVCVSGGKDSLSLLHTLHQYQYYARSLNINFDLAAVTVDPKSASYDPAPLIPYMKELNIKYLFERQSILDQALELDGLNSICSFCSRMKRGRLYAAARREGYNVLALGQHLDDLAESFLMSVFHNGRLRTMKASYSVTEGDLRVIRPFVYVREKELRKFADSCRLPVIPENCPACFESPKERHRVKQILAHQEVLFPRLFWSLKAALHTLMAIDQTGVESAKFGKSKKGP